MQNIGFEFNKKIFWNLHNTPLYNANCKKLKDGEVIGGQTTRKGLKDISFADIKDGVKIIKEGISPTVAFTLQIAWPGLYSGLGYTHETGESEEEFKTGFSFHYLTGVPFIPESSVKGVLRSSFPMRYKNTGKRTAVGIALNDILKKLFPDKTINIEKLELEIFGPSGDDDPKTSPVRRIRFECAVLSNENADTVKIFSIDTITPHDHPLHEPVPLRTLAISPGVKMDFYFVFNTVPSSVLCDTEIKSLFKHLLMEYGAGAKTNSGYGQFVKETPSNITDDEGYLDFLTVETVANKPIVITDPADQADARRPVIRAEFVHPKIIKNGVEVLAEFFKEDPTNPKQKIFKIISPVDTNTEVKVFYHSPLNSGKYILKISQYIASKKKIEAVTFVKQYHEN